MTSDHYQGIVWLALMQGGTLKKRLVVISVERERVVEIRRQGPPGEAWCEQCRVFTHLLKPEELAAIARLGSPQVFRLLEAGRLHPVRTAGGSLFICMNSLLETAGLLPGDEQLDDEGDRI